MIFLFDFIIKYLLLNINCDISGLFYVMSKEHARNTLSSILSGFMASASDSVNIASDQNVSIQLIETGKIITSKD